MADQSGIVHDGPCATRCTRPIGLFASTGSSGHDVLDHVHRAAVGAARWHREMDEARRRNATRFTPATSHGQKTLAAPFAGSSSNTGWTSVGRACG